MKNQILRSLLIVICSSILSIIAYRSITESETLTRLKFYSEQNDSNHVPLDTAISHIKEYVQWWNCIPDSVTINEEPIRLRSSEIGTLAYTIHLDDIVEALAYTEEGGFKYKSLRAYMGIDKINAHLYIVARDEKGNDVIPNNGSQYVYDLTTPCPNSCDFKSPLYQSIDK